MKAFALLWVLVTAVLALAGIASLVDKVNDLIPAALGLFVMLGGLIVLAEYDAH